MWTPCRPVSFRLVLAMEMLSQSEFTAPFGRPNGLGPTSDWTTGWTLWGKGTTSGFECAPKNGFRMDGEKSTDYVGLDYRL